MMNVFTNGHLILSVYKPNLRQKSDADIIRDAKLEAMGLRPEDYEARRNQHEKPQTATDEMVRPISESYLENRDRLNLLLSLIRPFISGFVSIWITGYGTIQKANAEITVVSFLLVFPPRLCVIFLLIVLDFGFLPYYIPS